MPSLIDIPNTSVSCVITEAFPYPNSRPKKASKAVCSVYVARMLIVVIAHSMSQESNSRVSRYSRRGDSKKPNELNKRILITIAFGMRGGGGRKEPPGLFLAFARENPRELRNPTCYLRPVLKALHEHIYAGQSLQHLTELA
ncbi:hypothetical protein LA080_010026 [Diaporthe eres]|nr:hypothetical protein LA080_010026 [Diaporthe eres]